MEFIDLTKDIPRHSRAWAIAERILETARGDILDAFRVFLGSMTAPFRDATGNHREYLRTANAEEWIEALAAHYGDRGEWPEACHAPDWLRDAVGYPFGPIETFIGALVPLVLREADPHAHVERVGREILDVLFGGDGTPAQRLWDVENAAYARSSPVARVLLQSDPPVPARVWQDRLLEYWAGNSECEAFIRGCADAILLAHQATRS